MANSKLKKAEKDLEGIENLAPNSFVAPSTPARISFSQMNATPQKKGSICSWSFILQTLNSF
jgi:hypothetical protein